MRSGPGSRKMVGPARGDVVDIGKPRRVITVEPETDPVPVPVPEEPEEQPAPATPADR